MLSARRKNASNIGAPADVRLRRLRSGRWRPRHRTHLARGRTSGRRRARLRYCFRARCCCRRSWHCRTCRRRRARRFWGRAKRQRQRQAACRTQTTQRPVRCTSSSCTSSSGSTARRASCRSCEGGATSECWQQQRLRHTLNAQQQRRCEDERNHPPQTAVRATAASRR